MKLKNLFYLVALVMLVGVFFTACSQSSSKTATADTEMSIEKGDQTAKCGEAAESKCGEGSDSTAKCGEGKCGEGKCGKATEETDSTAKCGESKCGA